eukprot:4521181-Prymnesium_polylepis.1
MSSVGQVSVSMRMYFKSGFNSYRPGILFGNYSVHGTSATRLGAHPAGYGSQVYRTALRGSGFDWGLRTIDSRYNTEW